MRTSLLIVLRALNQFSTHNAYQMAAALAYYMLFSLAPLLLLAIAIAGAIFGTETARFQVYEQIAHGAGQDTGKFVQGLLRNADTAEDQSWAPVIGILLSLFASLQAFLHLRQSFRTIWEMEVPKGQTYLSIALDYGLSALMVFVVGALLVASLAASTALNIVESRWPVPFPGGWHTVEIAVSFALVTLAFAAQYWVLSGRSISWWYVLYGSVICSVLFTIGKVVLARYLAFTSATSVYGAAGSLVGFLIWIYYSSLIVFLGAELIQSRRTRAQWLNTATAAAS
jgi:membrane protein